MAVFRPKGGQVDYAKIRYAPVINCVVKYQDKVLIVQRSNDLFFYPGYWNGISGFLDDDRSLEEKVRDELREELGLAADQIVNLKRGQIFDQEEEQYRKTWIVHPVLVEVTTNKIELDWESQNYQWVTMAELKSFQLLPGFEQVVSSF